MEARPDNPATGRDVFNVTEDIQERYPSLAELFASPGTTIDIDCEEGEQVLIELESESADVRFAEEGVGHDVYLRHEGEVYHTSLGRVVV